MSNTIDSWSDLTKNAFELLQAKDLSDLYVDRLKFELEEISRRAT